MFQNRLIHRDFWGTCLPPPWHSELFDFVAKPFLVLKLLNEVYNLSFLKPTLLSLFLLLVVASALGMGRAQRRCSALVRPMRSASGSKRRGPGVCVGVCVWFGLVFALSQG